MLFHRNKPELIIVGLGNPGPKYENTRHNAGFITIGHAMKRAQLLTNDKLKFKSIVNEGQIGEKRVLFVRPQTYMNSSGEAVREVLGFYKLTPESVVILYDDTALPPGKIRIRGKGSDGGHNGVKSIIECLGTDEFRRIRIGVGAKPVPEYGLADWVLGKIPEGDRRLIDGRLDDVFEALSLIADGQTDKAMNLYNG